MDKLRDVAIAVFFLLGAYYLYVAAAQIEQRTDKIDAILFNARLASVDGRETLRLLREEARKNSEFLDDRKVALKGQDDNLAYFFKSGKPLFNALSNVEAASADARRVARFVNDERLLESGRLFRNALIATAELLYAGNETSKRATRLLGTGEELLKHADRDIIGPIHQDLLPGAQRAVDNHAQLATEGIESVRLFNQRWPSILDNANGLLFEARGSAEQLKIGLARVNRPRTLRERLLATVAEGFLRGAPSALLSR